MNAPKFRVALLAAAFPHDHITPDQSATIESTYARAVTKFIADIRRLRGLRDQALQDRDLAEERLEEQAAALVAAQARIDALTNQRDDWKGVTASMATLAESLRDPVTPHVVTVEPSGELEPGIQALCDAIASQPGYCADCAHGSDCLAHPEGRL